MWLWLNNNNVWEAGVCWLQYYLEARAYTCTYLVKLLWLAVGNEKLKNLSHSAKCVGHIRTILNVLLG